MQQDAMAVIVLAVSQTVVRGNLYPSLHISALCFRFCVQKQLLQLQQLRQQQRELHQLQVPPEETISKLQ